jgi:hypothetical protein
LEEQLIFSLLVVSVVIPHWTRSRVIKLLRGSANFYFSAFPCGCILLHASATLQNISSALHQLVRMIKQESLSPPPQRSSIAVVADSDIPEVTTAAAAAAADAAAAAGSSVVASDHCTPPTHAPFSNT